MRKQKVFALLRQTEQDFFKKKVPLFFNGLAENKRYAFDFCNMHYEKGGAYLMNHGIDIEVRGVDYNKIIVLEEV